jgi:predicted phage tail protein
VSVALLCDPSSDRVALLDLHGILRFGREITRVVQAGAQPVTWVALAVELQRDWAREETVADIIEIVLTERLLKA